MAVVVDTDVASFIFKNDTRKNLYDPHLAGQFMFMSFMTLAELRKWSLTANWGAKKKALFDIYLRRYSIIHSTPELCQIWAEVLNNACRIGKSITVGDGWIAATALFFDVPVVTHNAKDFQNINGLTVISEK